MREPLLRVSVPPFTCNLEPLARLLPPPESVKLPPGSISIVLPLELKMMLVNAFGIALFIIIVDGIRLLSDALSPAAQPGKPPGGVQSAPEVSVQKPKGGGADEVTL